MRVDKPGSKGKRPPQQTTLQLNPKAAPRSPERPIRAGLEEAKDEAQEEERFNGRPLLVGPAGFKSL